MPELIRFAIFGQNFEKNKFTTKFCLIGTFFVLNKSHE